MYFSITICWLILPKIIAKSDLENLENDGNQQNSKFNNSFPSATNQNPQLFHPANITQNRAHDLTGVNSANIETFHSPGVHITTNAGIINGGNLGRFPNWPQNRTATQVPTPVSQNPNGNFYHPGVVSSNSNLMSQYAVSSESNSLYNDYSPPNFDNSIGQNPQQYVSSYFRQPPPPSTTIQRPITNQPYFNDNYLNDIHSAGSNSFEPALENGLDINTPSYFNDYQFNAPNIGAYDTSTFGGEHHFPNPQFSGFPNHFQTPYPQHNFPQYPPPHHPPPPPPHAGGAGYSVLNGGYFDGNSGEHHKKEEFPGLAGFGKKISKLINDFIDPDKDKHKGHGGSHHNKKKGGKYGDSLFGALTGFNDNKKINYKKIFGFGHG